MRNKRHLSIISFHQTPGLWGIRQRRKSLPRGADVNPQLRMCLVHGQWMLGAVRYLEGVSLNVPSPLRGWGPLDIPLASVGEDPAES